MQLNDFVRIESSDLASIHPQLTAGCIGKVVEVSATSVLVFFPIGGGMTLPLGVGQVAKVSPQELNNIRKNLAEWMTKNPPRAGGTGTCKPPPFGPDDLAAIQARADAIEDQQVKTDLFRLILEVKRLSRQGGV